MEENITLRKLQEFIKQKDYKPDLKHKYFLKLIERNWGAIGGYQKRTKTQQI